jgi:hypothetical protein
MRYALTFLRRSRKDVATGKAKAQSSRRCTKTGDEYGASTARAYCGGAGN